MQNILDTMYNMTLYTGWSEMCFLCKHKFNWQAVLSVLHVVMHPGKTRHRVSTSMYSLTFCVRVMSPERHHWKPAVQAAAIMLRTPPPSPRLLPVTGQPASHAHLPYTVRNFENAAITGRSPASSARTPRRAFVLSRDRRNLVTRVRVMLP